MSKEIIPVERIARTIFYLRGQKVILDRDLAILYGVETRIVNQAVKRNAARFPADFMFALTTEEIATVSQIVIPLSARERSRSQFVILKRGQNIKYRPYAFTEQGVAMLSSVLNSGWVAHASRVWVSVSRRNKPSIGSFLTSHPLQSPQWRDAIANTRDACATHRQ